MSADADKIVAAIGKLTEAVERQTDQLTSLGNTMHRTADKITKAVDRQTWALLKLNGTQEIAHDITSFPTNRPPSPENVWRNRVRDGLFE